MFAILLAHCCTSQINQTINSTRGFPPDQPASWCQKTWKKVRGGGTRPAGRDQARTRNLAKKKSSWALNTREHRPNATTIFPDNFGRSFSGFHYFLETNCLDKKCFGSKRYLLAFDCSLHSRQTYGSLNWSMPQTGSRKWQEPQSIPAPKPPQAGKCIFFCCIFRFWRNFRFSVVFFLPFFASPFFEGPYVAFISPAAPGQRTAWPHLPGAAAQRLPAVPPSPPVAAGRQGGAQDAGAAAGQLHRGAPPHQDVHAVRLQPQRSGQQSTSMESLFLILFLFPLAPVPPISGSFPKRKLPRRKESIGNRYSKEKCPKNVALGF